MKNDTLETRQHELRLQIMGIVQGDYKSMADIAGASYSGYCFIQDL